MYAFNKRFRPTTYKGLPYGTWAGVLFGLILLGLAIGAVFQMQSPALALLLSGLMGGCFYYAVHEYRNTGRARLRRARFIGKRDKQAKVFGL